MNAALTNKPQTPEVGAADSIPAEIEDDLAELLNRELRLISPRNETPSKKTQSVGTQTDLLAEFRNKLRNR